VHARSRGKRGLGAKFPTHYSRTPRLLEWFPGCKLVHTTRDPRAVYTSQAAKHTSGDHGPVRRGFERFRQFVHINMQVTWTARLHRKLQHLPNYRLVRYEDVVRQPEVQMRQLCEFLSIPFEPRMLEPNQYGSSFSEIKGAHGIENSSLERWRTELAPFTRLLMQSMHRRADRLLGYAGDPSVGHVQNHGGPRR
jgi:hypothetical protein